MIAKSQLTSLLVPLLLILAVVLVAFLEEHEMASAVAPGLNGEIAFTSNRDGNDEIYLMTADGSDVRRLTNNPTSDGGPEWSPDGRKIAFTSTRDGMASIYIMDSDGSGPFRMTTFPSGGPAWSPTNRRIAFVRSTGVAGGVDVYIMNTDGSNVRQLTTTGTDFAADWSPDGADIVFNSRRAGIGNPHPDISQIYVMDADGENQTFLTHSHIDYAPSWSPDGSKIAFASNRDGVGDIYVVDVESTAAPIRLTDSDAFDHSPEWSPDGGKLAFTTNRDGDSEIYVMNADGSDPMNVSNSPDSEEGSAAWQALLAGDVNCDGVRSAVDAVLILQLEASLLHDLACADGSDVNIDQRTDSVDATLILQSVAGLVQSLPVFS